MIKPSQRSQIARFIAMDVMAEANALQASGHDIVHLEVGQPALGAPSKVVELAQHAVGNDRLAYTDATGAPDLRNRIAQHYQDTYGVTIAPDRVVVTTGSSAGFVLAFLSMFDAGGRIGLVEPGYPAYRNIVHALDLIPVNLEARAADGFRPTPSHLDRAGELDGLMLASPANPTGTMLNAAQLQEMVDAAQQRGIALLSDEIYHGITFGAEAASALQFSDDVVVINSFSKYYAMTGWRLGWMVVPEVLIDPITKLQQNLFISPPSLSQLAGMAAFDCLGELDERVAVYAQNRAMLLEGLPKLGFDKLAPPDGAFYLYADVSDRTDNSAAYAARMLKEIGVAVTPGADFDTCEGDQFIRISFACSPQEIEEALTRLQGWNSR